MGTPLPTGRALTVPLTDGFSKAHLEMVWLHAPPRPPCRNTVGLSALPGPLLTTDRAGLTPGQENRWQDLPVPRTLAQPDVCTCDIMFNSVQCIVQKINRGAAPP